MLRSLDLSYNEIRSDGFLKLLSRLKKSSALRSLNLSGNDLSENQAHFVNLEKFLRRNESCISLQLNACKLQSPAMSFLGVGLAKNVTLERLSINENNLSDRESIQHVVKGLLDNEEGSRLVDIDLQKNRLTSASIEPLIELFDANYKLRSLNLRHNVITDEGA